MAERPIIFSAPMVRALLEGRKTQTRRIIKPHPVLNSAGLWVWPPYDSRITKKTWRGFCQTDDEGLRTFLTIGNALPYRGGDRLWVREATIRTPAGVAYVADGNDHYGAGGKLRAIPSIHMPRSASRLTLTVTDVRVERLQDISEEDARAEGIRGNAGGAWGCEGLIEDFTDLWESIHGLGSWEENPWVAALTFTVERNT